MVCTTSLTSLLARSGVSFDYDLASVCEELSAHQRCDEKTAEGYYMLWRCYSARRVGDHMKFLKVMTWAAQSCLLLHPSLFGR